MIYDEYKLEDEIAVVKRETEENVWEKANKKLKIKEIEIASKMKDIGISPENILTVTGLSPGMYN